MSILPIIFLFSFIWTGCNRNDWPSPLPETRLDVISNVGKSRNEILVYLKGKYLKEEPLIVGDTLRGESFWPIFICGVPGRLYISEWNSGPPGVADNIEGRGISWIAFGSHQVELLHLEQWVPPDLSRLNRNELFETLVERLKTRYGLPNQAPFQDSRYSYAFNLFGGKVRLMPEVQDTLLVIQFYIQKSSSK